jgi:hypothetical protein
VGLTEEDAKTKWCPFVRYHVRVGDNEISGNRAEVAGVDNEVINCIASRCMAWRWHVAQRGYCGLAGKP